jgi:hypothetical protein
MKVGITSFIIVHFYLEVSYEDSKAIKLKQDSAKCS